MSLFIVLRPLVLIQMASLNHLVVLSGSRSMTWASSHPMTWLLTATCSEMANLKILSLAGCFSLWPCETFWAYLFCFSSMFIESCFEQMACFTDVHFWTVFARNFIDGFSCLQMLHLFVDVSRCTLFQDVL